MRIFAVLFLFFSFLVFCLCRPGLAASAPPDDGDDPDLPPGISITDQADYLARRDAFVARLRGYDPNKPFDPTARSKANMMLDQQIATQRKAMTPSALLAVPTWTELGPNPIPNGQTSPANPVSGRIAAIEVDPADPNKVYVGAAQGGVYRSLDGGATWTPIFDGAQSLAIGALTLDPSTGSLWVGTGEANSSGDSFAGVGLYRIDNVNTTATLVGPINPTRNYKDAGSNPQSTGFFTGNSISRILIAPGNELFVSSTLGVVGIGGNCAFNCTIPPLAMPGLTRLGNVNAASAASITATRIAVGTGEGCFDNPCTGYLNTPDIRLDPRDATGNTLVAWRTGGIAAGQGGIYRSTNAMAASPAFTQTLTTTVSYARGGLVGFDRGDGTTTFYAATGESGVGTTCGSGNGALRRSADGGATWSAKLAGGGGFCGGQCVYNIAMDIVHGASSSTDKILLGGNVASASCSRLEGTSIDGAATTFTNTDAGLHADSHVIKIALSNTSIVYRGDDGGVWKSTDGGATWASLNNATMRATQFQSIAVHPTDANFSLGGTQDNGTEKLTTGPTWLHSDNGDGGYALIDQNATNTTSVTMYHTYFNQANNLIGYARSTDAGATWPFLGCQGTSTTNGIACSSATTTAVNFYAPIALGPGNPNTVYLGTDRLLRSSTSGTANATVSQAPLVSGVAASTIAISPQDDNYRIVGLENGALFFTTTGSSTLTSLDPIGGGSVIPDFYVARTLFDPTNKNTVYIALGGYTGGTAAAQSHVWKVTNLSTTPVVTPINSGLPDVPVNGLAVDPGATTDLYVGTDIGVFLSTDSGATWSPYGTGLPRVAVFDMAVQNVKKVLRIATHGRGMWEIPLNSAPVTDLAVTKSDGASTATSGGTTTYTVRVTNNGPRSVTGAILTDAAATGLSKTGVVCSASPGQCVSPPSVAQLEAGTFALPALSDGQFYEISVAANVTAISGSVTNTATIAVPAGVSDTNSANNAVSDTDTVTQAADLSITNSDGVSGVNAGGTTTYKVRVTDTGPSSVTGAILNDAAATGLSKTGVVCSATPGQCVSPPSTSQLEAGSFALPALANGQFYEISVAANVTALNGSVTNTATIAAATDPTTGNNSASDTDNVTPVADLAITKDDGVSIVSSGAVTIYKVRVTNNGPSSVTGATLTDAAATGLSKTGVTCSATPGQCVSSPSTSQLEAGSFALPALANGQFYEISVAANVTALNGSVTNTATIAVPAGTADPTSGNNSVSDTDTVTPVADLSITKSDAVASVNAGGTTSYKVRVTNNGPSSVTGAILGDVAVTGLSKTGVVCSATPGQCVSPPSVVQLEGGAFALPALTSGQFYEVSVATNVTAISGSVTNTATIAAPAGTTDPTSANNSDIDIDTVTPVADLSITKSDAVASVNAGGTTTYKVGVTNNGPSSVTGATLTDAAATGLSKTGVTCSATPGQCVSPPSVAQLEGGAFALPALTSGQFYEINVAANVTALSGAGVSNLATIAVPAGTSDPASGNNSATDTDTLAVGNLTISPVPLDFGDQPSGTTSEDNFVTLGNNGGGALLVSGTTVALAPFNRTTAGTCGNSLPITIAPSGSCTLSYTFAPAPLVFGLENQSFTVTETGTGTKNYSLMGNGIDLIFANGFQ